MCPGKSDGSDVRKDNSDSDKFEKQVEDSLDVLGMENEIVKNIKQLIEENRLKEVTNQRHKFVSEYQQQRSEQIQKEAERRLRLEKSKTKSEQRKPEEYEPDSKKGKLDKSHSSSPGDKSPKIQELARQKIKQEYKEKTFDYLQKKLTTLDIRKEEIRRMEIGDILFYFLLSDKEPDSEVQVIIRSLHDPLYTALFRYNWYELCCVLLRHEVTINQFFIRLGNNELAWMYLVSKRPQLLLNDQCCKLIETLKDNLPHEEFHKILLETTDNQGQTCMYYRIQCSVDIFTSAYQNHPTELLDLLSKQNRSGHTALHVETSRNLSILFGALTVNSLEQIYNALMPEDQNALSLYNSTVDWNRRRIEWVKNQFETKQYPLYYPPVVLILYNTTNRPGAGKEMQPIYDTFKQISPGSTICKMMGTEKMVLQQIKDATIRAKSGLILIMMSHGSCGVIHDSEGQSIMLTTVERQMCADHLARRPKVLIANSCQIDSNRLDLETHRYDGAPPISQRIGLYQPISADFCAIQSSMWGQTSERGIFIPYLAEQLQLSGKNENIIDVVSKVSTLMDRGKKSQTPIIASTLRAKFCLKDGFIER